jgi:hypothetical protein
MRTKKPMRAIIGELLQLLCEKNRQGKRQFLHNLSLWTIKILLADKIDDNIDDYCHRYSATP